jgi:glutamyl-tRNA synthetase
MPTIHLPITANPPFALLALARLQDAEIEWDLENGDKGEITYEGIKGVDNVRAELEKNVPGKEVC